MSQSAPHKVSEWMTRKIVAAHEDDTIAQLLEKMQELRIRHLPVVGEGDVLVGLITQRDLLHAASSFLSDREAARNELIGRVTVGALMQRELVTAAPGDTLSEAGRVMLEGKLGCMPVVNAENVLVGLLTEADFVRLAIWYMAEVA
jgi:CBS domain-containing membrane protein